MTLVMVPVPEALEDVVRKYLNALAVRSAPGGWSDDSVAALFDHLDEEARSVLTEAARGIVEGAPATVASVAEATGLSPREVRGIVVEISHLYAALGGPSMSILLLDPADVAGPVAGDDPAASDGRDLAGADGRWLALPLDGANIVLSIASRH